MVLNIETNEINKKKFKLCVKLEFIHVLFKFWGPYTRRVTKGWAHPVCTTLQAILMYT